MAANDSVSNELSKKTRKVEEMNEKGQEYANMQAANQHLQEISAERMKNVALQRQDVVQTAGTAQLLAEAGQMANMDSGDSQPVTLNPSTQATLSKFGLGQPRVQRTQGRSVSIKPNNITINNTYNTTTNNNVNPGPLQGRTVTVNPKAETPAQSRYKTWISNVFAKQKLEQDRKEREYDRREWSLTKSANKMIRKMESASRDVANTFNPKNIGQTIGNQFKILMFLFGMKFLAKNWTGILDFGKRIYDGIINIGAFFGIGDKGRQWASQGRDFRGRLITFLGGPKNRNNKNATLFSVFKEIFDEFREYLKIWFEKQMALRGVAMRNIKFPDLKIGGEAGTGVEWVDRLISGFGNILSKTFSGVGTYLGDILTALVDPKAGISRSMSSQLNLDSREDSEKARYRKGEASEFTDHGDFNSGDYANVEVGKNGKRKYSIFANAIDSGGNLNEGAGNEVSQGRDILGAFQDAKEYGALDTSRAVGGLERLYNAAEKRGSVIVDGEFMNTLYGPGTTKNLVSQGKVKEVKMKFVEDTMTTDDKNAENEYANKVYGNRTLMGEAVSTSPPVAAARILNKILTGELKDIPGVLVNSSISTLPYREALALVESYLRKTEAKDKKYTLVPESDPRSHAIIDGRTTKSGIYYQLTPEALDYLAKSRFKSDRFSKEHYTTLLPGAEALLTSYGGGASAMDRNWKLKGEGSGYFSGQRDSRADEYLQRYQDLKNTENKYNALEDASDWRSYRVPRITNNAKQFGNDVISYGGEVLKEIGAGYNAIAGGRRADNATIRERKNYIMRLFTEKGLSPAAAAGIIGNLMSEGLQSPNPGKPYSDGKAYSYGIAGFYRYGEAPRLEKWANAHGLSYSDWKVQAQYLTTVPAFERIRRITAGMSPNEALARSAVIWGHDFEKFQGFTAADSYGNIVGRGKGIKTSKGVIWGSDNYKNRIRRAADTLRNYGGGDYSNIDVSISGIKSSPATYSYTTRAPMISLNPSVSSGGVSKSPSIVWLGDSQTCTANSGFPKGVAAGLGVNIPFFGMGSARASHYLGKEKLASTSSTNIPELKGKSCNDAFTNFLGRKPNYCIIALGHNGNSGMQELISAFRNNGSKVIVIKMWATKAAPGTGMKSYTSEESNALYAGLNADGFVDLTRFEVKKTSDGVHADAKGCKDAAAETVRQLKGGGFSVDNDSFNSSGSEVYSSGGGSYYGEGGGSYSLGDDIYNTGVRLENWQPFNVKTEAELKQDRRNAKLREKTVEFWQRSKDVRDSFGTYEKFEKFITSDPKAWKLLKGVATYINHADAIKSDDEVGMLGVGQFAREWAKYDKAPWDVVNQWEENNKYNLREKSADSFITNQRSFMLNNLDKGKVVDKVMGPFMSVPRREWDVHSGPGDDRKALKELYENILKGEKSIGYSNKVAAGVLFGDEYIKLTEELKKLNEQLEDDKDNYSLKGKRDDVAARMKNYEASADTYMSQARGKDVKQRRFLLRKNQKIAGLGNSLLDIQKEKKALDDKYNKMLYELRGKSEEELNKVQLDYLDEWAAIEEKEKSIRARIDELSSTMSEDQKKFIKTINQNILLGQQTNEQLTSEFQGLVQTGMSEVDAIHNMIKKYGEGVLERMREKLAETDEWFRTHAIEEYHFDPNYDYSKGLVTQEAWEEYERRYGKGKVPKMIPSPKISVSIAQEGVTTAELLNDKGFRKGPIRGKDKVKAAANRPVNYWTNSFGLSSFNSTKNRGVAHGEVTGYNLGAAGKGPLAYPTSKNRIPGRAIGGYTEPGEVLEESKYKLHKGEWVAPQWMVKSKEFGSIIKSLENHRRTVSGDAVKTNSSDDKAKSLDIAANISTAQNTSGTNQRLDQLIQIIASQGKAQGRVLSPKTREQSFTR